MTGLLVKDNIKNSIDHWGDRILRKFDVWKDIVSHLIKSRPDPVNWGELGGPNILENA